MKPRLAEEAELQELQGFFGECDDGRAADDFLFGFPTSLFVRDPDDVCVRLQNGYTFLTELFPNLAKPSASGRLRIGYRHRKDEKKPGMLHPGWDAPSRRINVPWYRLFHEEREPIHVPVRLQPEFCCTHEFVHPFITQLLKDDNKKWEDAFCDCLRAPLMARMGFDECAKRWRSAIGDAAHTTGYKYHDAAGRILRWLEGQAGVGILNATPTELLGVIESLVAADMDKELDKANTIKW